ncbi:hypothetical protein CHARACLAT_021715 [Characodon lateralis]|uniref:Uncharacterized protein n=1 Tax=Characodon lateralis TaxID=208331 RepID=A0ABU7EYC1_9TELE|nr:hypothetical protein [Characodon lateralis]
MAKSSFTKQANFLSRRAPNMTEMELREEFKKLTSDARHAQATSILKIRPIILPKFYGYKRNFHRWKKDWENLQKQGIQLAQLR